MATLEEIYGKIVSDEGEKQALAQAAASREGTAAFLEQRGCEAAPEEFAAFLKEKTKPAEGELSDAELEGAAGGGWCDFWDWITQISVSALACLKF